MSHFSRLRPCWCILLFVAGCDASDGDGASHTGGGTVSTGGASSSSGGGAQGGAGQGGHAGASGGGGNPGVGGRPVVGLPGVWEDVTPPGIDLSSDFGTQDVLADPTSPGTFYGFVCLQGVYKSTDWGASWEHVSTDGQIEQGRPWGEAMAPDGSYMLASTGYGPNAGAWKSTDGGATWSSYHISNDNDPYSFDIDPSDPDHVLVSMHASENIYESQDGGESWDDRGPSGAGGSNYVFFITSGTWLVIGQSGSGAGTRRSTNSGGSWQNVGPMEHAHGNAQIFIDPDTGHIFAAGHEQGVYRSTDGGASFQQVSSTRGSSVWATGGHIYSMDPGANAAGTAPMPQIATRGDGTDWEIYEVPSEMTNGAKRAATAYDAQTGQWVIVSGNWNAGFWRYIEPPRR